MAILSMNSLLFTIPSLINLRLNSHNPSPSFSAHFLSSKTTTKPLSVITPRISSFTGSEFLDRPEGEGLEVDGEEQEEVMQVVKVPPKRLKKDIGRLYIGNLPFSTTSNDLMQLFGQAGTVVYAEVIYDRVTDRSRGFAFVNMISSEQAENAIQMFNQSLVKGRQIQVNFPEIPRGSERDISSAVVARRPSLGYVDTAHKLYAGNLGWYVNSETLKSAFKHIDGLLGTKVVFDRETGRSRGYGFVVFESEEVAFAALESMNGVELEGRPLRLSYATDHRRQTRVQESSNETPTDMQESSSETSTDESSNETPTDTQESSSDIQTDVHESTNESSTDMQESSTGEMETSSLSI